MISAYQKHHLIPKTKKKLKAEPPRTGDDPESPACKSDMFVDIENIENAVFNQDNSN